MRFSKHLYIALISVAFISCTEDIDIDLESSTPELVVDGVLTTDTMTHTVYLKKTADYFSNVPAEGISGAMVTLSDGTSTITLNENANKPGAYQTPADYHGVVGKTYTLNISNVDANDDGVPEEYEASSTIATQLKVDSVEVTKTRSFGSDYWYVNVWMQDPPVEHNYYLIKAYRNDTCVTDSMQLWGVESDEIFNGYYLDNVTFVALEDIDTQRLTDNDKVTLEVSGISEDYMYFVDDVIHEYWGRNPLFGGQPANVRTNISLISPTNSDQKVLGFFAAYAPSRFSTVFKEKEE